MKKRKLIILEYGRHILESEYFAKAGKQTHHIKSDVASHSINTALFCVLVYKLFSLLNIKLNLEVLIVAALAHDIGILGRKEKFSTGHECITEHPVCSVDAIKEIEPDTDKRVCDAISSHMYPLGGNRPNSREGWVLTFADKYAACTDHFRHYKVCDILSA